ncbi:hypothetical protein [Mucilaginibacter sp.]|jgi:hypothetical protein|uniref:hypothetical protein n=1 Tax=Mucilaginibacter sp. TaxID=1882438 RepID=UPI002BA9B976|nr:hypothetical protein [Mucilaginibacter sp.]HTI58842.1 hypothetical protein [Mucilaginibacter sp.]
MRKIIFVIALTVLTGGIAIGRPLQQKFEKAAFYAVMKSGDIAAIDNEIQNLSTAPEKDRDGYTGALLMKKADLLRKNKDKLKSFKEGRIKLETALIAEPDNTEFHFLRLTIEEHAPRIVKYRSDIEKDKAFVIKNFKNLSPAVQHAILDYCSNSKVLHKEDL